MTKKAHRFLRLLFLAFMLGSVVGLVAIHHEVYRLDAEVTTSGNNRGYLLHVPKSYRAGQPTPLVISFHGFGEWPAHLMRISGWNQVADEFGFIVAYPRGSSLAIPSTCPLGHSLELNGAYLGLLWIWTGNLSTPMIIHAVYDFAALVYFLRVYRRR